MRQKAVQLYKKAREVKSIYDSCHIAAYAAEAAFFMLLSAVPLLMLFVIFLGLLAPFDVIGVREIFARDFTVSANRNIQEVLNEIVANSTIPLASVTTVVLVWSATKGIRSIGQGLAAIYNNGEEYNLVQLTLRSVAYTFVMAVVLVLSLGLLVLEPPFEWLISKLSGKRVQLVFALLNSKNLMLFVVFVFMFATAYKALAKNTLTFKQQLGGAALASAGWIVYSWGFSIYIRYFSGYSAIYGSLGAVILFLLWLYMCMNILLCGALFNKIRYKM